MWKALCQQLAKRFFRHVAVYHGRVYDRNMLGERLPIPTPEAESTLTAVNTSYLMALPAELLQSTLRYAIADSVVEVRKVQDYLRESAFRMIDFPFRDAVNAGGPMPSTAASLLRVNKTISRVLVTLFDLPDTLFCRNTDIMCTLMLDMDKYRTHIHIRKIICKDDKYKWLGDWNLLAETDEEAIDTFGVFILKSKACYFDV